MRRVVLWPSPREGWGDWEVVGGSTPADAPKRLCCEVLRFSKSSAGRRTAAARVCRKYPEAFARVANGELKLSVLVELNKYLSS